MSRITQQDNEGILLSDIIKMFRVSQEYPPHNGVFSILKYVQILHYCKLKYWYFSFILSSELCLHRQHNCTISEYFHVQQYRPFSRQASSSHKQSSLVLVKFVKKEVKKQIGRRWHCLPHMSLPEIWCVPLYPLQHSELCCIYCVQLHSTVFIALHWMTIQREWIVNFIHRLKIQAPPLAPMAPMAPLTLLPNHCSFLMSRCCLIIISRHIFKVITKIQRAWMQE